MLTYTFKDNSIPLYIQAYNYIKNDIVSGILSPNEKLPSKRAFAENNGISIITIQNAYEQLSSEGYIYAKARSGYYVSEIKTRPLIPQAAISTEKICLPKKEENIDIDLSSNKMDPDNFPFSIWAKISRDTISNKSRELMEISPSSGCLVLREAIKEHLRSFRGMLVDPAQIIIGAGTEYLYGLIIQLLGYDKTYCTENPGYKKLAKIYEQYNINCNFLDMDEKGLSIKSLNESKADIAHISPNHHFPTGITMPADRRYEILAWANEASNRYIIEDDYDSEFRINKKPIPTLFSIDACQKVIYINTFSKSLSPTIRISYMILPVELANLYYKRLSFYSCTVSNFEQYTLASFIKEGYFEKHINRMRLYYARQRQKLINLINLSPLKEKIDILENESGLHFLIRIHTRYKDKVICERLAALGIKLVPLYDYYLSSKKVEEHYFLINYSNLDMEKMPAVFDKIAAII